MIHPIQAMADRPALSLSVLPDTLAVCRLAPDADVPAWAWTGEPASVTRTRDELSIVCRADATSSTAPSKRCAGQGTAWCEAGCTDDQVSERAPDPSASFQDGAREVEAPPGELREPRRGLWPA